MNQLFFFKREPPSFGNPPVRQAKDTFPQSLVIKVWLEYPDNSAFPIWRARFTHVETGQHYYADNLRKLLFLYIHFLTGMGVKPPFWWRFLRRFSPYPNLSPGEKPPQN